MPDANFLTGSSGLIAVDKIGAVSTVSKPPSVYMPAAAMLTEQNPPWAAKFGVPNCAAQYPVNDWL